MTVTHPAVMRTLAIAVAVLSGVVAGCGSDAVDESRPAGPIQDSPTAAASPGPTRAPGIVTSDAVPSLDELRALGLGDAAAQCFISTIDPQGTGRVASADLFLEAFATCG